VESRPLATTGLTVTPIGIGLAALGRPAYITPHRGGDLGADRTEAAMRDRTHQMLDLATDLGVRYIDVARSYGLAELFLAGWLERHPSSEMTIGSKWGYRYVGGWQMDAPVHEVKDHSLSALQTQWAESRRLLGGRLRLYQIHSATPDTGVLDDREVLAELIRIGAEEGVVMGLTTSGSRQAETVERALAAEVDGVNPFRQVQATWNVLEPSAGGALQAAHQAGWGVMVKESLANGRLAGAAAPPELAALAGDHGVGTDAVAIAAALAQPWVDTVLSGAVTPNQFRSNLDAAGLLLSQAEVESLQPLATSPDVYWTARSALDWS
jgi:aryl-alcohol dehydrogenase-like predicted oxidoreductase